MRVLISLLILVVLVSCAHGTLECGQKVKGHFKGKIPLKMSSTPGIIGYDPVSELNCRGLCSARDFCTGFSLGGEWGECHILKGNNFTVDDDQTWTSKRFCKEPECVQEVKGNFKAFSPRILSTAPNVFGVSPNCRKACEQLDLCTGFSISGKLDACRLIYGNDFAVDDDQTWTSERVCK